MDDERFRPDSLFAYTPRTGFREKCTNPKGFLTGTLTLHLPSSGETSFPDYQRSVMYYDEHGRKIQTVSDHHLNGGDRDFYNYNSFTGSLIKPFARTYTFRCSCFE